MASKLPIDSDALLKSLQQIQKGAQYPSASGLSANGSASGWKLPTISAPVPTTAQKPNAALGLVGKVLKPLTLLSAPMRAVVSSTRELVDVMDSDPNTKASWDDWKKQAKDPNYGFGTAFPMKGWTGRLVGFIGDVALDPLTYATFGSWVPAKAAIKGIGTKAAGLSTRAALGGVKTVSGRQGRTALAKFLKGHVEDLRKAGRAEVAGMTDDAILKLQKDVAAFGKSKVPGWLLDDVGIRGPGVYYFGSRVKVPASGIIAKFIERDVVNRGRLALVHGSKLNPIHQLHKVITPKGVGTIADMGPETILDYRVRLANGSLSPREADVAIVTLGADDARRLDASTHLETGSQVAAPLAGNPLLKKYDDTIYRQLQHENLPVNEEEAALTKLWRFVTETLHGTHLDRMYKIDPKYPFMGKLKEYFPYMESRAAIEMRTKLGNKEFDAMLPNMADYQRTAVSFRTRRTKPGDDWFGYTLTEEDMDIDKLNWMARNPAPNSKQAALPFDYFETSATLALQKYVHHYAQQMGHAAFMEHILKQGPEYLKYWEKFIPVSADTAAKGMAVPAQRAVENTMDALWTHALPLRQALDAHAVSLADTSVDSTVASQKLLDAIEQSVETQLPFQEAGRAFDDMLENVDGTSVAGHVAKERAVLDDEFKQLQAQQKVLKTGEATDELRSTLATSLQNYVQKLEKHSRDSLELLKVQAAMPKLSTMRTVSSLIPNEKIVKPTNFLNNVISTTTVPKVEEGLSKSVDLVLEESLKLTPRTSAGAKTMMEKRADVLRRSIKGIKTRRDQIRVAFEVQDFVHQYNAMAEYAKLQTIANRYGIKLGNNVVTEILQANARTMLLNAQSTQAEIRQVLTKVLEFYKIKPTPGLDKLLDYLGPELAPLYAKYVDSSVKSPRAFLKNLHDLYKFRISNLSDSNYGRHSGVGVFGSRELIPNPDYLKGRIVTETPVPPGTVEMAQYYGYFGPEQSHDEINRLAAEADRAFRQRHQAQVKGTTPPSDAHLRRFNEELEQLPPKIQVLFKQHLRRLRKKAVLARDVLQAHIAKRRQMIDLPMVRGDKEFDEAHTIFFSQLEADLKPTAEKVKLLKERDESILDNLDFDTEDIDNVIDDAGQGIADDAAESGGKATADDILDEMSDGADDIERPYGINFAKEGRGELDISEDEFSSLHIIELPKATPRDVTPYQAFKEGGDTFFESMSKQLQTPVRDLWQNFWERHSYLLTYMDYMGWGGKRNPEAFMSNDQINEFIAVMDNTLKSSQGRIVLQRFRDKPFYVRGQKGLRGVDTERVMYEALAHELVEDSRIFREVQYQNYLHNSVDETIIENQLRVEVADAEQAVEQALPSTFLHSEQGSALVEEALGLEQGAAREILPDRPIRPIQSKRATQIHQALADIEESDLYPFYKSQEKRANILYNLAAIDGEKVDWTLGDLIPPQHNGRPIQFNAETWAGFVSKHNLKGLNSDEVGSLLMWLRQPEVVARIAPDKVSTDLSDEFLLQKFVNHIGATQPEAIASSQLWDQRVALLRAAWDSSEANSQLSLQKAYKQKLLDINAAEQAGNPVRVIDNITSKLEEVKATIDNFKQEPVEWTAEGRAQFMKSFDKIMGTEKTPSLVEGLATDLKKNFDIVSGEAEATMDEIQKASDEITAVFTAPLEGKTAPQLQKEIELLEQLANQRKQLSAHELTTRNIARAKGREDYVTTKLNKAITNRKKALKKLEPQELPGIETPVSIDIPKEFKIKEARIKVKKDTFERLAKPAPNVSEKDALKAAQDIWAQYNKVQKLTKELDQTPKPDFYWDLNRQRDLLEKEIDKLDKLIDDGVATHKIKAQQKKIEDIEEAIKAELDKPGMKQYDTLSRELKNEEDKLIKIRYKNEDKLLYSLDEATAWGAKQKARVEKIEARRKEMLGLNPEQGEIVGTQSTVDASTEAGLSYAERSKSQLPIRDVGQDITRQPWEQLTTGLPPEKIEVPLTGTSKPTRVEGLGQGNLSPEWAAQREVFEKNLREDLLNIVDSELAPLDPTTTPIAHAAETAAIPSVASKEISMRYSMEANAVRPDLRSKFPKGTTTLELVQQGHRTATTRAKFGKVGDVFTMAGDATGQQYLITGIAKPDLSTAAGRAAWEAKEGWSLNYIDSNPKLKGQVYSSNSVQTTFKPFDAEEAGMEAYAAREMAIREGEIPSKPAVTQPPISPSEKLGGIYSSSNLGKPINVALTDSIQKDIRVALDVLTSNYGPAQGNVTAAAKTKIINKFLTGETTIRGKHAELLETLRAGYNFINDVVKRGSMTPEEQVLVDLVGKEATYLSTFARLSDDEVAARLNAGMSGALKIDDTEVPFPEMGKVIQQQLEDGWKLLSDMYPSIAVKMGTPEEPGLAELWQRAAYFSDPKFVREMRNHIGFITKFHKTYATLTPGFHVRNFIGNVFQFVLAGGKMRNLEPATKIYLNWMKAHKAGQTWSQFLEKSVSAEQKELAQTAYNAMHGSGGGIFSDIFHAINPQSKAYNWVLPRQSRKLGQMSDNMARFVLGFDSAMQGMNADMATARVRKFYFDYEDLSKLDVVMKEIMPFWIWTSRNLPLQLENMWLNPKPYLAYQKFVNNVRDKDAEREEPLPEFLKETGAFRLPGIGAYAAPDLNFTRVPQTLSQLTNPKKLGTNLNPLFRVPIEQALGRNLYNDEEMESARDRLIAALQGMAVPVAQTDRLLNSYGKAKTNAWLSFFGSPVKDI